MVSSLVFLGLGTGIIIGVFIYWYVKNTINELWDWLEHEGML